jgi:HD-like signal output (HDOD) protein/CheY-like chemotaxis protein
MKRILFVDDEKNILDGVRRMLHTARNRWEMEFVTSGGAALLASKQRAFDVVVTDLRMPGMNGAELLGHIRDQFPGTARIVLSGYSEPALAARAAPVAYRVLGKPCNAKELVDTIERVCTLQDLLCTPALRQIIGTITELPSWENAYAALSAALRNPATPIADVVEIIQQDVAMSAKVLQLVNSGFFGLPQRAITVEHAVNYLGLDKIRTLALYSETFRVFVPDARIPESFARNMQQHSQRTAIIAGALPLPRELREAAFVAGLLHDVGELVLASTMPEELCIVLAKMEDQGSTRAEAEEELLGISHAEIGAYLLGLWGINEMVVEAVAHHHHPTRITHTALDCSSAVYLANLLAHELENHPNDLQGEELLPADRKALQVLGVLQQFASFRVIALEALN